MYGIIRHCCVILTLLVLYREWSNNPPAVEAFVAPRPPRVNVGAPGGDARAAGPFANEINSRGAGGGSWRTADHLPRRRRSREAGGGGGSGCGQGVRSLRAGLGFPPLPGSELVDFMAQELVEQSVRHHWQSGFIGGSVGVMGTLTAIQVCVRCFFLWLGLDVCGFVFRCWLCVMSVVLVRMCARSRPGLTCNHMISAVYDTSCSCTAACRHAHDNPCHTSNVTSSVPTSWVVIVHTQPLPYIAVPLCSIGEGFRKQTTSENARLGICQSEASDSVVDFILKLAWNERLLSKKTGLDRHLCFLPPRVPSQIRNPG